MEENKNQHKIPKEILGLSVIGLCPECKGEGVLWGFDEQTHWVDRCKFCNCVGYLLDLPEYLIRQSNDCDIPF